MIINRLKFPWCLFCYQFYSDKINALLIVALWVLMVSAVNPIGEFPLNDDWVYSLVVKSVLESGYYYFSSISSANLGPQAYWGALFCLPFGFSFTALRISSLVLGLMGIIALYFLIRQLDIKPKLAFFGALVLAVNPLYFGLANSFMTDVPFISLLIISIYFFVRGIDKNLNSNIAAGVLFSILAILIRQLGVLVLIGFAVAYLIKYGPSLKNFLKVVLLVFMGLLAHFLYQSWLVNTGRMPFSSGHSNFAGLFSPRNGLWNLRLMAINSLVYLGFYILPFMPIFYQQKVAGLSSNFIKIFCLLLFSITLLFSYLLWWKNLSMPSMTNVLIASGLGPLTLRDTFILNQNNPSIPSIMEYVWFIMTFLSAGSVVALILYCFVGLRQLFFGFVKYEILLKNLNPLFFLVVFCGYYFVLLIMSGGFVIFDRYLLPLVPISILLLLSFNFEEDFFEKKSLVYVALLLVGFYSVFSVCSTRDYLEWNRVRWIALNDLLTVDKVRPNQIDGGYEFNGLFTYDAKYLPDDNKSWWWVVDDDYVIASGALEGYKVFKQYSFKRWLVPGDSKIFVLVKNTK